MLRRAGLVPLLLLFALMVAAALVLGLSYRSFLHTPLTVPDSGVDFTIASGESFSGVATELEALGVLEHPEWFKLQARLGQYAERVQAGEYHIAAGTTPEGLLEQLCFVWELLFSERSYIFVEI